MPKEWIEDERRTDFPEKITPKQDSGHAPYVHFECERPMPPDDSRRERSEG